MRPLSVCTVLAVTSATALAQLTVTAVDPPRHASNREPNTSIVVDFDRAVQAASLGSFGVYGASSGPAAGAVTLENGDTRIRFAPARAFAPGEVVSIGMSETLQAQDGSFLRTQGYVSTFRIETAPAPMTFTALQQWDADPSIFARIYGAQTCDLNDDDFADLAFICENSSDVRVFMNEFDATGLFGPMLPSPSGTGAVPSPNESGDLNDDGFIDLVTCDTSGDSVSVLLGNGDGTFQPTTIYSMGFGPHGMALLDVDGDGDLDVATANTDDDDLSLRRNNGDGTLGAETSFAGGVTFEWAMGAADFNNDGIVDLVVGGANGQARVHLSNGNGTFAMQPSFATGGNTWMIACGDLNGDGNYDVTMANGNSGTGVAFLGNGAGGLTLAQTVNATGHCTATDVGDIDGDGDLDWVLSAFGGSKWLLFENNGAGVFVLDQTFPAVSNPGCASLLDIDGDRDLDLALLDEVADTCVLMENGALAQTTFCYGTALACPCGNAGENGHGCEHSGGAGGGLLVAQGRASVANDTLALNVSNLPPAVSVLFFQGTNTLGGGNGLVFGDGLRCVASPVIRLGLESAVNGFASIGSGNLGDPPLSVKGQIPPAGATRRYQAWYRNSQPFCTSGTVNFSNGLEVIWTP